MLADKNPHSKKGSIFGMRSAIRRAAPRDMNALKLRIELFGQLDRLADELHLARDKGSLPYQSTHIVGQVGESGEVDEGRMALCMLRFAVHGNRIAFDRTLTLASRRGRG